MKKIVSLSIVLILLISGLFVLTGCENEKGGNSGYNKEVSTYNIKTKDETADISFEFMKDEKYETTTGVGGSFVLKNKDNYAEIKISALHDSALSATITKEAKDFYSDKYHDYQKVTVGSYNGWSIYEGESKYETNLMLTEKEAKTNKVYAIDIQVIKSPLMPQDQTFDVKAFVESKDFQHLLESIKINVKTENTQAN